MICIAGKPVFGIIDGVIRGQKEISSQIPWSGIRFGATRPEETEA
jgi:hypothetical protein